MKRRRRTKRLPWHDLVVADIAASTDDRLARDAEFFEMAFARNPSIPAGDRYRVLLQLIREEIERRKPKLETPMPDPLPILTAQGRAELSDWKHRDVVIDYTNPHGVRAEHHVTPNKILWESTARLPQRQWLLYAQDAKGRVLVFAMSGVHGWRTAEAALNES